MDYAEVTHESLLCQLAEADARIAELAASNGRLLVENARLRSQIGWLEEAGVVIQVPERY